MKILEVKNISKSFKNDLVLDDVSFNVNNGETLCIIGPSGGGKTTLLRCLNYLEFADKGEIVLKGETYFDAKEEKLSEEEIRKRRSRFGLVFQNFNLFPQYSVLENITLAMKLAGKTNVNEVALALLDKLGLANKKDTYPEKLSGGQQQRVAIARALAMEPDILCFDEPTSALDPNLTNEVAKVINGLKDKGQTMIVVSHDMHFAKKVADRIILVLDGKIVENATTDKFFNNPKNEKTKQFIASSKE